MRAGFGYIFTVLVSSFLAVSPAFAARAKALPSRATVVQTSLATEQQRHSQHCDKLEDNEVIPAIYNQHTLYGPVIFSLAHGLNSLIYPINTIRLPAGRDNARIQPFYQLILFPFHSFW